MAAQPPGVRLSVNLDDPEAVPYFLWDEPMSVAELRARLVSASEPERLRLLGKILREARDTDVWRFTTPVEVARLFPLLRRHLGRRRTFWEFLLGRWQELADGGRSEIRDLVDVRALEGLGLSLEQALLAGPARAAA